MSLDLYDITRNSKELAHLDDEILSKALLIIKPS